ncbi:MAG: 3-dehydroquinate synthase [Deltaproteobacteria bacterium]|nr:3-dehydroquinate synthase [Deltaproteobacteria bacterium]MBI4795072.1 3-dehydroquinate synthase [Deltaproteobacteria bacterium]
MREITLPLPGRDQSYQILIDPGLRLRLPQVLGALRLPARVFIVTDTRVGSLYGDQTVAVLKDAGYSPTLLTVPRGEKAKTWPVAQRLARELLARGADRSSPLLALGGGVVGDLTGFLASIFMRGVPFIQIPTTLLAMVDAAIGGKTAINLPEGKNLLGTFHQPRLVAIDPQFLQTLPASQRRNGLAEVLKAGFIRDPDLLTRLDKEANRIFKDEGELTEIIHRAAAIKAEVVAADEREGGLRRILNFGHTLGHGLEQASKFRLPHGEAVAWGMLAALRLSEKLAGLAPQEAAWGRQLIRNFGLARSLPRLDPQAVLSALTLDKKRQQDRVVFVLLKRLGEPVIQEDVPLELIKEVLHEVVFRGGN